MRDPSNKSILPWFLRFCRGTSYDLFPIAVSSVWKKIYSATWNNLYLSEWWLVTTGWSPWKSYQQGFTKFKPLLCLRKWRTKDAEKVKPFLVQEDYAEKSVCWSQDCFHQSSSGIWLRYVGYADNAVRHVPLNIPRYQCDHRCARLCGSKFKYRVIIWH